MAEDKAPLVIISGPTGAGKSALALKLAKALKGEIINADSLALYRGFDIGTAKPDPSELASVPHHLVNILDPDEDFDAAAYLKLARPVVEELKARQTPSLAVGGAGFYLRALTQGIFEGPGRDDDFRRGLAKEAAEGADLHARLKKIDPEAAARLAPADRVRIERALEVFHLSGKPISRWQREHALSDRPFRTLAIVLDRPADELDERLRRRTGRMLQAGLVEEVEGLLKQGWSPELKPFGSIGYKETLEFLKSGSSKASGRAKPPPGPAGPDAAEAAAAHGPGRDYEELREKIFLATRRYAKRQRTWFRGQMPEAVWFHPDQIEDILPLVKNFFARSAE